MRAVSVSYHNGSINQTDGPFEVNENFTYQVDLPLSGALGLTLVDDTELGMPMVVGMPENLLFKSCCKKNFQTNR